MADPSRKMANRSGNAQLGILPSGGSPPLCKAERRLSFQWVGLCKRCLRKFFAYAPVVAARPLLCAQIHTWGGGGPEGAWNCGFRARLTSGRCRGQEKDGQSFWRCAMGILPNGCSRPIDRRRIRRPPSSPSFLGLAAIDALYPKRCPKRRLDAGVVRARRALTRLRRKHTHGLAD